MYKCMHVGVLSCRQLSRTCVKNEGFLADTITTSKRSRHTMPAAGIYVCIYVFMDVYACVMYACVMYACVVSTKTP
jgi:hypothetical protein